MSLGRVIIAKSDWFIRAARAGDWRALRMLLPDAVQFGSGARAMVAALADAERVVGAAALLPRSSGDALAGPRVAVHVIPTARRRGIGRAMIEQCITVARAQNAQALHAAHPVPLTDDRLLAWRWLGFDQGHEIEEGRIEVARALAYLEPLHRQVVEHGWIAPEAQMLTLDAADAAEVARLHVANLGGNITETLARMMRRTADPLEPSLSPVLVVGGIMRGFTAVKRVAPDAVMVESTVVDSALRLGWANLWLKYAGFEMCRAAGITYAFYQARQEHTDTRRFATQVGATRRILVEPFRIIG